MQVPRKYLQVPAGTHILTPAGDIHPPIPLMGHTEPRLLPHAESRINNAAGTRPRTYGALAKPVLGASPISIEEPRPLTLGMDTTPLICCIAGVRRRLHHLFEEEERPQPDMQFGTMPKDRTDTFNI